MTKHEPIKVTKTVKEAVDDHAKFMTTYDTQSGYEKFDPKIYIDDVLYGLGISLSDDNKTCSGLIKFKKELLTYLQNEVK